MTTLIGISGGSGSGKTSFIEELKKVLPHAAASFISFDNYYRPREEQQADEKGIKNFDLPTSMNFENFRRDLTQLESGHAIELEEYVFNNDKAVAKQIRIEPAPVIIIEGLFVYHFDELRTKFDLKLFINAQDEIKLIRRIKRDQIERNYPIEDVLYRYEKHVMPSYNHFIAPYISEMDIIINNNDSFGKGLAVVAAYVNSLG